MEANPEKQNKEQNTKTVPHKDLKTSGRRLQNGNQKPNMI